MSMKSSSDIKKIITRFGEVEYDPDKTLTFPDGLIGFGSLREFIVMPNRKEGPLFWIQSVEDPQIAFVVTDPTNFFLEYRIIPNQIELDKLGVSAEDEYYALAIVTVPPDQKITLNLAAPIVYTPKKNRAIQIILENTEFGPKTPLPDS